MLIYLPFHWTTSCLIFSIYHSWIILCIYLFHNKHATCSKYVPMHPPTYYHHLVAYVMSCSHRIPRVAIHKQVVDVERLFGALRRSWARRCPGCGPHPWLWRQCEPLQKTYRWLATTVPCICHWFDWIWKVGKACLGIQPTLVSRDGGESVVNLVVTTAGFGGGGGSGGDIGAFCHYFSFVCVLV